MCRGAFCYSILSFSGRSFTRTALGKGRKGICPGAGDPWAQAGTQSVRPLSFSFLDLEKRESAPLSGVRCASLIWISPGLEPGSVGRHRQLARVKQAQRKPKKLRKNQYTCCLEPIFEKGDLCIRLCGSLATANHTHKPSLPTWQLFPTWQRSCTHS